MATLSAGASASFTLTAGNQISGVGAGTAVIGRAGTVQALTAGDAWRIGPYLTAQTVSITSTSAMVYAQVAQVSADPSPADLGLTAAQVPAIAALVSTPGNQPSATLAATVGTAGQVVRLSDGPDAGALLVWAIPQGASAYAWCWWLWPQSAY